MDQIYPNEGLIQLLQAGITPKVTVHLYTTNTPPSPASTLGGFTEAGWAGYVAVDVLVAAFTFSSVVGNVASLQAPNVLFSNGSGSPVTAYGFYVTNSAGTLVLWAAQFDGAPITIPASGTYQVTPIIGNYSGLSS
jgi:predicted ATP-grasp superfamily ATP-dependent carboligase